MDEPDAVLVGRARAGDRAAMASLIRRHQGVAFGVAYRLLGSREDAEDAAQEAFVQVLTQLDRLLNPGAFVGWLRKVTANLCLDRLRRGGRVVLEPLDAEMPLADTARGPEAHALDAERRQELERALASLPAPYRVAVVLRDVEGMTYAEVAALLRVPEGTVKSRIHAGRRLLRQVLASDQPDRPHGEEMRHAEV